MWTAAILLALSTSAAAQMSMPPADLCAGDPATTIIPAGARVTYSGAVAKSCVTVRGSLTLAEGTQLTVRTLQTHEGGTFTAVGRNIVIQTSSERPRDPDEFGTGLVFSGGAIRIEGTPKTAWTRLTRELLVRDTTLAVEDAQGWEVGDRLVVPDTRDYFAPLYERQANGPEVFTIKAFGGAGLVVLDRPAAYEHPAPRNADERLAGIFPPVGNLTRSVEIRSADPAGVRGHLMLAAHVRGSVKNVAIADFGRTTNDPLGAANHIGRYAAHLHFIEHPGFVFSGNVVERSTRWGITVHHSNEHIVRENVVLDSWGAGLMTEDGTEHDNRIERNLVVKVRGTDGRGDERPGEFGVNGSCFWLHGPLNQVSDNIGANCGPYAFTMWGGPGGCINVFSGNEAISSAVGFSIWYVGKADCTSYVDRFKAWHNKMGRYNYPTANVVYRDTWVRGDPRVQSPNYWSNGVWFGDYDTVGAQDLRLDVQNVRVALIPPYGNAGDNRGAHVYSVIDSMFDGNLVNIHYYTPSGSYPPAWQLPNTTIVQNTKHGSVRRDGVKILREFSPNANANLISLQRLLIMHHEGTTGDSFEVFMREQASDFVIPNLGLGAPEPNLTNAQAWERHRVAIAGAVAPCATTRQGVYGFTCALKDIPGPAAVAPLAASRNVRVIPWLRWLAALRRSAP